MALLVYLQNIKGGIGYGYVGHVSLFQIPYVKPRLICARSYNLFSDLIRRNLQRISMRINENILGNNRRGLFIFQD